jgi:hypothetical protein
MRAMRALATAIAIGVAPVGAPRAALADVVVERVGVEVAPVDRGGKPWDREAGGAAPDPQIEISFDGKRVKKCPKADDSLTAECDAPQGTPAAGPLRLELHVEDVDRLLDEPIGDARATIPPDADGRVELAAGGKLVRAWAEVRRVGAAWLPARAAWPLGAVAGAALALLAYAIFRRGYLTPGAAPRDSALEPAGGAKPRARFWRSPVLLAGAAGTAAALITAGYVYAPGTQPLVAAIPLALGAFAITGTIIDAFVHEHLGATRGRVLLAGGAAAAAVPIFQGLDGPLGIFQMVLGGVVIAMILWSVLDSI